MIIASAARIAVSAAILTLAGSCARNMIQTARTVNEVGTGTYDILELPSSVKSSSEATVRYLQSLSRRELLILFCRSRAPSDDLTGIVGEWNGQLLDNNGWIMTRIGSEFMTNALFSMGKGQWNGKRIHADGKGVNRFLQNSNDMQSGHGFDVSVEESKLFGNKSARLDYSGYHHPLSLWKTMEDQVRLLPVGFNEDVLIGMGCMLWSGGMLNAAPFCLYRCHTDAVENGKISM